MEWLATAIRTYKGQASVIQVQGFDDLPPEHLKQLFVVTTRSFCMRRRKFSHFLLREGLAGG
jgi:hypothetical protein